MTWVDIIIPMVRDMIGDTNSASYTYCDDSLQRKILTAINLMQIEINFSVDYVADIAGMTLTPDPVDQSPRDIDFMTLAALKTACLIERSEVSSLTSQDVQQITDNGFTMKIGDVGKGKIDALKVNWCVTYNKLKTDFLSGTSVIGKGVLSPFPYWGENGRYGDGIGIPPRRTL